MFDLAAEQERYLLEKEAFLDQFIERDDEYQLFISSYIHGHFSVVAAALARSIAEGKIGPFDDSSSFQAYFEALLRREIDSAIANEELSDKDAQAVLNMLSTLFK